MWRCTDHVVMVKVSSWGRGGRGGGWWSASCSASPTCWVIKERTKVNGSDRPDNNLISSPEERDILSAAHCIKCEVENEPGEKAKQNCERRFHTGTASCPPLRPSPCLTDSNVTLSATRDDGCGSRPYDRRNYQFRAIPYFIDGNEDGLWMALLSLLWGAVARGES